MRGQWAKSEKESERLIEAGMTEKVLDDAIADFILEVVLYKHTCLSLYHNCLHVSVDYCAPRRAGSVLLQQRSVHAEIESVPCITVPWRQVPADGA